MTKNLTALEMKIDWSSLSGITLDGGYELKEAMDARDTAAKVRVKVLGSGGKTGIAYFMHLESADAEDQFDVWSTLKEAPHPNLSRPLTVGKLIVGGHETVYMVLPDADEKLAAVVPERPLEWEEAAEVLHSCEKGLAHLHAHGLIHGSVSPGTIEAVGYTVLLNTEGVHRIGKPPRVVWSKPSYLAPESKNLNLTTAADVWCLGATLFEVLSQERYGTPGVELEQGLPLAAVIQRCLDKNPLTRCTLKEAPAVERAAPPTARVAPAPEPVQAEARPAIPTQPAAPVPPPRPAAPAARVPPPLTPRAPAKPVGKEDMALVPTAKRHKKVRRQPIGARIRTLDAPDEEFVSGESMSTALGPPVSARIRSLGNRSAIIRNTIAAVGLLLLFVAAVWFIIYPKLQSIDQPLNANGVSAQTASDANRPELPPNLAATPSPQIGPAAVPQPSAQMAPAPAPAPPPDTLTASTPRKTEYFRVVLDSFTTHEDAVQDLQTVAQKHPELILHVSRMKVGGDLKYVVSVGGVLDRSDAEPLQQRLLKKGLTTARLEPTERELTRGR